ncbi:MAG: Lrp/AsnC family transcriptional regulator [Gammaproteobacteria bacterium]|uniref:Lrp/AsnC family transcriptional regulator n=1 Tax=Pseudomaricurvus alcaniphilus TaxID=1166482 RepID=UPI0014096979|nr:Lrp/AsnC family transcriptional regulator [Pseudomaricurvus alcaniphilus]MBR9912832.1 Lrp/AsnC family transcriptional regulator [Gammaproteobacteria bacterium]NHN36117.1 Lrp/AsnC family transcriptional regulator [Pseudomaricurvus alcaniphilus]
MKFDRYEWQILQILQKEGQITNQELAERIGLSTTPCWRRLTNLNQSGVIRRYAALLDPKLVGIGEVAFANVTLDGRQEDAVQRFEEEVNGHPEVLECYASMGEADYVLKVAVPDISAYDRFLQTFLLKLPYVVQVRSNFALRAVKQETALPLEVFGHKAEA